ncbi:MAG: GGDEF domain-containing protein [Betaproteobacteria bacterium HGW-Betaproteobacteria-4]|jgi:diguanylate cyclase (GGDEF)-like protein|nr:MAG: GGDEF domain-containing protein [Betaproteobacteria bacterium HGW-Betaproteobacteria-4]
MSLTRISKSLVTRMILFGVLLVVSGALARYFLLGKFLREDLIEVVSAQQIALAKAVAGDVDHQLTTRWTTLSRLGETFPLEMMQQPDRLTDWLAERRRINPVFLPGLVVADKAGIIIADFPAVPGRRGASVADIPDFAKALAGHAGIGKPQFGAFAKKPVLPMGIPLKDKQGVVQAVLVGISALDSPGFLGPVYSGKIGKTGGYLLISPRDGLFVAASDPDLVLKPTPPLGVNLLHDRAMQGFRGAGVTINAKGIEELSAMAEVPSTGWFVVARMPTAEAFEAVTRVQERVIKYGIFAVILVCVVVGVVFRFLLRPLFSAADLAERMTQGELPLKPLPVVRDDEVGHLTSAFNRLLEKLSTTQAALERMAHHDPLTGLLNRNLLADRMQQAFARAKRNGTKVAVLFLDLDGFKPINDELGHEFGDAALVEVARRLSGLVRQSDTLARVGGDEFVIVITDLGANGDEVVKKIATKCIEVLSTPVQLQNIAHPLGVSIGIAMSDGLSDPGQLLKAADLAMYVAKKNGRSCYAMAPESHTAQGNA